MTKSLIKTAVRLFKPLSDMQVLDVKVYCSLDTTMVTTYTTEPFRVKNTNALLRRINEEERLALNLQRQMDQRWKAANKHQFDVLTVEDLMLLIRNRIQVRRRGSTLTFRLDMGNGNTNDYPVFDLQTARYAVASLSMLVDERLPDNSATALAPHMVRQFVYESINDHVLSADRLFM